MCTSGLVNLKKYLEENKINDQRGQSLQLFKFLDAASRYASLSVMRFKIVMVPSAAEIDAERRKELEEFIKESLQKIEAKGVHDLTITNMIEHVIDVIPGTVPIRQKRRPVPPHYMDAFQRSMKEMEDGGLIEKSNSPWSSPIHIVRKEGGAIRITQDFRKLNGVTVKDAYPIPNIENMFSRLAKAKIFKKLDLTHGYWQIGLVASKPFTAFRTSSATFRKSKSKSKISEMSVCSEQD